MASLPFVTTGHRWKTYHGECDGLETIRYSLDCFCDGQTSLTHGSVCPEIVPFDVLMTSIGIPVLGFQGRSVNRLDGQQTDACPASGR